MHPTSHYSLLIGARDAIGVWAVLVALAAMGFALMHGPRWREHILRARIRSSAARLRRDRYEAQHRCAQELAAAAANAAVTAHRRRTAWADTHAAAEKAWQAFEAADLAARRAVEAAAVATAYANQSHPEDTDLSRHPAVVEMRQRLATRDHLLRAYLDASAAERVAWRAADLAAAAKTSLATEALTAATRVRQHRPAIMPIPRQRTAGSGLLHPATR
ncbi:hypothetical protein HC031_29975 [Planosporangium thailandense]|uniref:Uncharacterized protein n=1 Tax=Planosporangium thailandense TaxID=765197 RepID=A0ABX0Y9J0_9ACTN|nr:hypothetical protein [Planosporangium thailandense]NJC73909.1 hypothetical protein [Planosporangium thailandense]